VNIYPPGSLLEFSGISLENGKYKPGQAIYVMGSHYDIEASLIAYLDKGPTTVVFAVENKEIRLARDQRVQDWDQRKRLVRTIVSHMRIDS